MIKYKIYAKYLEQFQSDIEKFVSAIQEKEKDILEYNVFQAPDGLSFVHYISFPNKEAQMRHVTASHTKKFNKVLKKYAETPPIYIPLNETGQAQNFIPDTNEEERKELQDTSLYQKHPEMQYS